MSNTDPLDLNFIQDQYAFAIQLLNKGYLAHQVESRLVENGLEWEFATTVVSSLIYQRAKTTQKFGIKNLIMGIGFCGFGIVLAALIFQAPNFFNVKYYLIAEVTILVGLIAIFLGIFQFLRGLRVSNNESHKNNVRHENGEYFWSNYRSK